MDLITFVGTFFIFTCAVSVSAQTLKVTTILEEPYSMKKKGGGTGNDQYEGFIPKLLEKLMTSTNFSYELQEVKDGLYGGNGEKEGGQWNGMVGEVHRGEVDLAAAPLTIVNNRREVVEFSNSFMSMGITVLMKKPAQSIKTADDLVSQSEVKYGAVSATKRFFRNSKIPQYVKMWRAMERDSVSHFVNTTEAGVKRVRESNGKYAFLMESTTAAYVKNQEPCDLYTLDDILNSSGFGFAAQKTSSGKKIIEKLNEALIEVKRDGTLQLMYKKWWKTDGKCARENVCSSANGIAGPWFLGTLLTAMVGVLAMM